MIYNGDWTEWKAIRYEILWMILNSNERASRVRFEIASLISDQNAQHEVQPPLYYIHFEIVEYQ